MAFRFKKSRNPNGGRELVTLTFADSSTYTVGDSLKVDSSGYIDLSAGSTNVFGILVEIVKADGSPVTDNGAAGDYVGTYTTPASNTVQGIVDVSIDSVYSVPADATLGTTTGSDLAGYNMDVVAASDTLDESEAVTTTAQFFSYGPDPDSSAPSNSVLVSIQESQLKI